MNPDLTKRIIDLLTRHMSQSDRHGYIQPWCVDYSMIYEKIDWSGAPREFTVRLVERLNRFGTPPNGTTHALVMLLQHVRSEVGEEDQVEIDDILLSMSEAKSSDSNLAFRMQTTYHYLPPFLPPRVFHFTGRDEILDKLHDFLLSQQMVALCGPGGIGKTSLALEVIYRMMDPASYTRLPDHFSEGILFHSFHDEPTTRLALINLLRQLSPKVPTSIRDDSETITWDQQLREDVHRVLRERHLLLILDGSEKAVNLQEILDIRGNCSVLITTQQRKDARGCICLDVNSLSDREAVSLLQKLTIQSSCNEADSKAICQKLDNLPFAIQIAGNYMFETGMLGPEFLDWLNHTPLQALDQGRRRKESISILLSHSLEQISETGCHILALMGRLALASVDSILLVAALEQEPNNMRHLLGELFNYNLLCRDNDGRYRFSHALIHTYASERLLLPPDSLEKLGVAYANFIEVQKKGMGLEGHDSITRERVHISRLSQRCADEKLWSVVNRLEPNPITSGMRAIFAVT